ncbi:MAG: MFS transporter [Candidatus Paracaedibacteraceae bacterium]|nr:MFS transporter [Candidatus Paracaedibacteraceae bacterium]
MNKRAVFSSFIGNTLEFYDFALYGALAGLFTKLFFPHSDPVSTLFMNGVGVFSIGLIARPLGGLIFGYIGDRYSRRLALSLSMYLMAIPSFIIMVVPTYATIGILAPVLLVSARILQGFCTGGEYNGAAIFALEHQEPEKKGIVSGMMTASSASGLLLATLVSFIFTNNALPEWAWRIPFLFGMLIALFGYYIRRKNLESPEFQKALQQKTFTNAPILEAFAHYKFQMFITALIAGQTAVLAYMMFTLITPTSILPELHQFNRNSIYILSIVGLISFAGVCVVSGHLSDKLKTKKIYIMISASVLSIILIAPIFKLLLSGSFYSALCGQVLFGCLTGLHAGPQHIYMQELFPNTSRYSAVSFSFSLGTGLLGGLTPQITSLLIKTMGNPALWVITTSFVLFVCLLWIQTNNSLITNTRGKDAEPSKI